MIVAFIDCGEIDGVRYVDVVDDGFNPLEYTMPLELAVAGYGEHDILSMSSAMEGT